MPAVSYRNYGFLVESVEKLKNVLWYAFTLIPLIIRFIKPGKIIISDQWLAYLGIKDAGFEHHTVNHLRNFDDPETLAHTQNVEICERA